MLEGEGALDVGNWDVVLGSVGPAASCLGDLQEHGGASIPLVLPL